MNARDIIAICQRKIALHPNDCAGFARAVANDCGVMLTGNANMIVSQLGAGKQLLNGLAAKQAAAAGELVIGGRKSPGHGHVVVIVDGPLNRGRYPYAFWGQYRKWTVSGVTMNVGFTRGHGTLNYAFMEPDRDHVTYAAFTPIESLVRRAGPNEGYLLHTFA